MGALVTAAEEIRDETTPGANTAERVGEAMVNQAQAIENSGQVKIYTGLLSQEGVAAPTAIRETNTIGAGTFTYDDVGAWTWQTSNGAVPNTSKIIGFGQFSFIGSATYLNLTTVVTNEGKVVVEFSNRLVNGTNANDITEIPFKIEVYP